MLKLSSLSDWLRRWRMRRKIRMTSTWWNLYNARFDYPRIIDIPQGQRILMLSPHPDDDVVGAGGTLLKHHQAGCKVTALVLTDGSAGVPGRKRIEIAQIRRREEETAVGHLGIEQVIFWDEPDGALAENKKNADRLRELLGEIQPDIVYAPSFFDNHPDHRIITHLLARAIQGTDLLFTCAIYETSTPIVPNVLVDISMQMETKLQAVGEHRSQLEFGDYLDLVRAMGRWRSGAFSLTIQYAEAFYLDNVLSYLALWRQATRG